MIAGQIKRLSSASESLPGNNKCLGNQYWLGGGGAVVGRGSAWESDCSIFKLRDTNQAKDGGEFPAGGRKKQSDALKKSHGNLAPLAQTHTSAGLGGLGGLGGAEGEGLSFLLRVKNVLIPDNMVHHTN